MTGRKHSLESLAKLSGENHYMFGKTHNQEAKDKISASMKGIRLSEEHKKKFVTSSPELSKNRSSGP
jgi:hypothetical protein